jgi:hypothetical protein
MPNVRPMVISFVTDTLLAFPVVVNCLTAWTALPAVLAMATCTVVRCLLEWFEGPCTKMLQTVHAVGASLSAKVAQIPLSRSHTHQDQLKPVHRAETGL